MSLSIDAKNVITINSVDEFEGLDTYITNDTNNNYPVVASSGNLRNHIIDMIKIEGDDPEMYKEVLSFPGYSVSNHGNVRNDKTRKMLKPILCKTKSPRLDLCSISCDLDRLVAVAFIPNPENKRMLEHIDNDVTNNHVDAFVLPF